MVERLRIDSRQRAGQAFDRRRRLDRALELSGLAKSKPTVRHAALHRIEIMRLDLLDQFVVERIDLAGDAEGAVAQVAAGAAGDLASSAAERSRY